MATLQSAIDEIQTEVRALSGIRSAPDEPPDQMGAYPFAVAYAGKGVWSSQTPETKVGLHDIVIELHVARKDLARDVTSAMSYSDSIPNAIMLALKDGTFSAIETFADIAYEFVGMGWGGVDTLGFRFTVRAVKMSSAIS